MLKDFIFEFFFLFKNYKKFLKRLRKSFTNQIFNDRIMLIEANFNLEDNYGQFEFETHL